MRPLAGNQTWARIYAQRDYEDAVKSGADKSILDRLYAVLLAAQTMENAATGQNNRPRKLHW